jgi:hypothetical protein
LLLQLTTLKSNTINKPTNNGSCFLNILQR